MSEPIALCGAGRIGRAFLRALAERSDVDRHVSVYDLATMEQFAYLLANDSTRGSAHVQASGGRQVRLGRLTIEFTETSEIPEWGALGLRTVVEATGRRTTRKEADLHLEAGAERVVVSAPAEGADRTVVVGHNHDEIRPSDRIISAASCTTNCLVPIVWALDRSLGVEASLLSTVHSYTSDQALLDKPHRDARRGRSAATNIVPTTTGAARAVGLVVPTLSGKCDGRSFRVPVANVSLIDLTVMTVAPTTVEDVNHVLAVAADASSIMDAVSAPLVSTDILGRPASCTVDLDMTQTLGRLTKVVAWYDNEWGYANRLVELVEHLGDSR